MPRRSVRLKYNPLKSDNFFCQLQLVFVMTLCILFPIILFPIHFTDIWCWLIVNFLDFMTQTNYIKQVLAARNAISATEGYVQNAERSKEHPVLSRTIPPGEMQQCVTCGECFTNWDRILGRFETTNRGTKLRQAEQVKVTGSTGAYSSVFEDMEKKLTEIRTILDSASISNDELVAVQGDINQTAAVLSDTTRKLNQLDGDVATIKSAIMQGDSSLGYLKTEADNLEQDAQSMKNQITALQETNVKGALNLTSEAKRRADEAADKVAQIQTEGGDLANSERQRIATETKIKLRRDGFEESRLQNQQNLQEIVENIRNLEDKIPGLNQQVCDGTTSVDQPCDSLCGGAGCDKCGGLSCLNGALSKANEAGKRCRKCRGNIGQKARKRRIRFVRNSAVSATIQSGRRRGAVGLQQSGRSAKLVDGRDVSRFGSVSAD